MEDIIFECEETSLLDKGEIRIGCCAHSLPLALSTTGRWPPEGYRESNVALRLEKFTHSSLRPHTFFEYLNRVVVQLH